MRLRGGGVVVEKPFLVVYGAGLQKPLEMGFHFKTMTTETRRGRYGKGREGKRSGWVGVFFNGRKA